MASAGGYAPGGTGRGGGAGAIGAGTGVPTAQAARARQVQLERRRVAQLQQQQEQAARYHQQQQQYHVEEDHGGEGEDIELQYHYEMEDDAGHSFDKGGYHSDANDVTMTTAASSSGAGGGPSSASVANHSHQPRSPASSTRSSRSGGGLRGRLSAKRHNMMQRRIEMRRKHEEERKRREEADVEANQARVQQQEQQQQEQFLVEQSHENQAFDQTMTDGQVRSSQPQHLQQPVFHQQHGQGQRYHNPQPANPGGGHGAMNFYHHHHQQPPQNYGQDGGHPFSAGPHKGYRQSVQQWQQQPQLGQQQQHHQSYQQWQPPQAPPRHQQHQLQPDGNQYSEGQPLIPSPPTLQRKQQQQQLQQQHQQYHAQQAIPRHPASSSSPASWYRQQQQQKQQPQPLLRTRNYDSPSDEWNGHNAQSQGVTAGMMRAMAQHQVGLGPGQQKLQQPQPQRQVQPGYYPHGHFQGHPPPQRPEDYQGAQQTMQFDGAGGRGLSADSRLHQPSVGGETHHHQTQQLHPRPPRPLQYASNKQQHQPDWNEVDELYQDDNRRRVYQRQFASMQQFQERQQEQAQNGGGQQQQPQQNQQQQRRTASKSPHRTAMSTFSPVEHLGNRSDQIQRKNKFVGAPPSSSRPSVGGNNCGYSGEEGEEEGTIVSVSEQARKFETMGHPSRGRTPYQHHRAPQQQQHDDETVSVASIRKGWEDKHQQRSKPMATTAKKGHRAPPVDGNDGTSPFGMWEERANRLAKQRRREQRREQQRNIEDRWMKHRTSRNDVRSLPPPEKRVNHHFRGQDPGKAEEGDRIGYQSEGERLRPLNNRDERYALDGYQSEGQELVRRGNRGPPPTYTRDSSLDYVDSEAITPQDARRRLWDTKERLRAVLPRNESFDSIGDVKDRWPQEQERQKMEATNGRPQHHHVASPSNHSGSSAGGASLFKSRFVHAAALAVRQRRVCGSQQERCEYEEERRAEQEQARQRAQQQQHENDWPQHDFGSSNQGKKSYLQKGGVAVSSHYTDSTAETTTATTTPGGGASYGSSPNHHHATPAGVRYQQNGPGSSYVRKVSPSPPKRLSSQQQQHHHHGQSTMPSIDEQDAEVSPSQLQAQQTSSVATSSVADLIARINAVSRSNPEEALAAIDSILKREGGAGFPARANDQASRNVTPSAPADNVGPSPSKVPFSPSRNVITPPNRAISNNVVSGGDVVRHLGKDFFQERYEEVLKHDSQQVIRDARAAEAEENMHDEEDEQDDDDDDSLLESDDDSTVSSMTNPTYQSLRPEQMKHGKNQGQLPRSNEPIVNKYRKNPPQQQQQGIPNYLPTKPQKSWNTLKREYADRKSSPPRGGQLHGGDEGGMNHFSADKATSSEEDLGLDKFNPEVDPNEGNGYQEHGTGPGQQPKTISKSNTADTNEFTSGLCGMNYHMSTNKPKGASDAVGAEPPTPSTLTDTHAFDVSAWDAIPKNSTFGSASTRRKNNASRQAGEARSKGLQQTNEQWPFGEGTADERRNAKTEPSQPPRRSQPPRGNEAHKQRATTPKLNRSNSVPKKRASTPEIMAAVSNAFSNVDISFEGDARVSRLATSVDDPPLQTFESSEGGDDEPLNSLQTISEAFSDIDVSFDQPEKTASQRRKELEYLATSWTKSKSQSHEGSSGSSSFVVARSNNNSSQPKQQTAPPGTQPSKPKKKKIEPTIRLKGNKSLAQKFANLVRAYDD